MIEGALREAAVACQRDRSLQDVPAARLAIVVDQMEQLFTLEGVTADERRTFVQCLAAAVRARRVMVIATLRSDFFQRCQGIPELVALMQGDGQYNSRIPVPPSSSASSPDPRRSRGSISNPAARPCCRSSCACATPRSNTPQPPAVGVRPRAALRAPNARRAPDARRLRCDRRAPRSRSPPRRRGVPRHGPSPADPRQDRAAPTPTPHWAFSCAAS